VPRLIRDSDLRGAFHLHTLWSDGRAAIAAYARAARALGWRYLGIADHAQSAFCGGGLSPERLALQAREIAQVGRELPEVRIFHGIECDIDLDGGLAYDASLLASLDFVVISLHAVGGMDRDQLTARTIRALHHPAATILAHPSGRLLRERPGCPLNWQRLFAEAAAAGVLIEYNTSPDRLDLDWRLIRAATSRGAGICVNPDAHRLEALGAIPAALETARKGWLSPEQVFNTLPLETVEERLHARRARQS
jgi:DNA polymerase (family 10)